MHLRSITLEGYRSAAHGKPLVIDRLGRFNIFIGPNNSGKSTVCRFLQVVADLVGKRSDLSIPLAQDQVDSSWWWQNGINKSILATLVFASPAPKHQIAIDALGSFEHDGEWRVSVSITTSPSRDGTLLVSPYVYVNNEWYPVTRHGPGGF